MPLARLGVILIGKSQLGFYFNIPTGNSNSPEYRMYFIVIPLGVTDDMDLTLQSMVMRKKVTLDLE